MRAADDSDVVDVMIWCRRLGLTVHVRGTDERPVIELKARGTNHIIGGIELKRRIENWRARGI